MNIQSLLFASLATPVALVAHAQDAPHTTENLAGAQEQLLAAAIAGDVSAINAALDAGALVNGFADAEYSPLILACLHGKLDAVKALLAAGADIALRLTPTRDALAAALFSGHAEIAHYLIEQGAPLVDNPQSTIELRPRGAVYLEYAAQNGMLEFVTLFLDSGVALEDAPCALLLANTSGHTDCVRLLLERGASANQVTQMQGFEFSQLALACYYGHAEIALLLLEAGADINSKVPGFSSAICLAVQCRHRDCALLLLEYARTHQLSLDLDSMDASGMNALLRACSQSDFALALEMIKAQANVNLCDGAGYSPLLYLAAGCDPMAYLACIELIRAGAELDHRNKRGESALIIATQQGNKFLVDLLLKLGANRDLEDGHACTALNYAWKQMRSEFVMRLSDPVLPTPSAEAKTELLHQATKSLRSTTAAHEVMLSLQEPLMQAIESNDATQLMDALSRGADINALSYRAVPAKDDVMTVVRGKTQHSDYAQPIKEGARTNILRVSPLSYACALNAAPMAKLLLERGAKANLLIGDRSSALAVACEYHHAEVVHVLMAGTPPHPLAPWHDTYVLLGLMKMGERESLNRLLQERWKWTFIPDTHYDLLPFVREGRLSDLKELVALGLDMERCEGASYLLYSALNENHLDVLRYLLEQGADPNQDPVLGVSLVQRACALLNAEALAILLQHGAVSTGSAEEYKVIVPAIKSMKADDALLQLARLEEKYPIASHPERAGTLLMVAIVMQERELILACLDAGVDLNARSDGGLSALNYAYLQQDVDTMEKLLNAGADVDLPVGGRMEGKGMTLLMVAANDGNLPMVQWLVEHGADIKAVDEYGDDARLYALGSGHGEVVDYLDKVTAQRKEAEPHWSEATGLTFHAKNRCASSRLIPCIFT